MKINTLHKWHLSIPEARAIQKNLSAWLSHSGSCEGPRLVARIELQPTEGSMAEGSEQATVTLIRFPGHEVLERKVAIKHSAFPREPGLLSFRKAPAIIAALEKLNHTPDLLICDGRGSTGPDTFGVAAHVGLLANLPTIGIRPPKPRDNYSCLGAQRGSWLPLETKHHASVLLRVISAMDPLLVSAAHRIDTASAMDCLLRVFPTNMPSRDYLSLLYPERYQAPAAPVLRVVKDSRNR